MNRKKIYWEIEKKLYQLHPLDAGILFFIFFILFIYSLVIPQYEKNLHLLNQYHEEISSAIQQKKIQNSALLPLQDKVLAGTPLVEVAKFYKQEEIQVIDSKYDQKSEQIQFQLEGEVKPFLKVSKYLQTFSNLELLNITITQNERDRAPELLITWQVKVAS